MAKTKTRRKANPHADKSPAQWQQPHDPVEPVEVIIGKGGANGERLKRAIYMRRSRDVMIWGKFSQAQEEAAINIALGRDIAIDGGGVKAQNLVPSVDCTTGKGEDETAARIRLWKRYAAWMAECPKRGIVNSYVLAIVCSGYSMRSAMQTYRVRHETISEHLTRGLDLYSEMFG